MTLVRKHERVDGKFDVEPEDGDWLFVIIDGYDYGCGVKDGNYFRDSEGMSYPWSSVTAYIDPLEEVAPVEVVEDREIGRGTFITYCDKCGQEHMVGRKCRECGSHSCSEANQ